MAAVELATRNSRRDGFFSDINKGGYGCGKVNTWDEKAAAASSGIVELA